MLWAVLALFVGNLFTSLTVVAETCITQSAMDPATRNSLATRARDIASAVLNNNSAELHTYAAADLANNFGALQYLVATTSPKLAGTSPVVEEVYILDATNLKAPSEAQFFCSLNNTTREVQFDIPSLPPAKYAFVIVDMVRTSETAPTWRLSLLLRQDAAAWQLAGLYPKALTTAGHDGLWYWTQARQFVKDKEQWNAWLYYRQAAQLLQPTPFILTTHLDKLHSEATAAEPSSIADGISATSPLVLKGSDGTEYHITSLGLDDSTGSPVADIAMRIGVDSSAGQTAEHNTSAAVALLAAHPEFRKPFHGVMVIAEAPGQSPFSSEIRMAEIK